MNIDPKTNMAPHDCPECGEPAYLGFGVPAKCSNRKCRFFDQGLWVDHIMALPDEQVGQEFDIDDDEPTLPDGWVKVPNLGPPPTFLARQLMFPGDVLDDPPETKQEKQDRLSQLDLPAEIARARREMYRAETGAGLNYWNDYMRELQEALDNVRKVC